MLTNDQIAFFNEFGFLVFRQLFDSKELETMALEGDAAREEIYQGHEDGPRGSWVPLLRPSTPFSASLLEDARFHSVANLVLTKHAARSHEGTLIRALSVSTTHDLGFVRR